MPDKKDLLSEDWISELGNSISELVEKFYYYAKMKIFPKEGIERIFPYATCPARYKMKMPARLAFYFP